MKSYSPSMCRRFTQAICQKTPTTNDSDKMHKRTHACVQYLHDGKRAKRKNGIKRETRTVHMKRKKRELFNDVTHLFDGHYIMFSVLMAVAQKSRSVQSIKSNVWHLHRNFNQRSICLDQAIVMTGMTNVLTPACYYWSYLFS